MGSVTLCALPRLEWPVCLCLLEGNIHLRMASKAKRPLLLLHHVFVISSMGGVTREAPALFYGSVAIKARLFWPEDSLVTF